MKSIHPKYYDKANVQCVCGNKWLTGATVESLNLEICDKCHPFYSGDTKHVDTHGRIEKFRKRAESHLKRAKIK